MRRSRRFHAGLIGDFLGALALFVTLWAGLFIAWGMS